MNELSSQIDFGEKVKTSSRPVNAFSSPWKKSDVVFVVQDEQLHVHRQILTMQSPVFEAMLDGHFKEARQEKISLVGKDYDDMVDFLKLLYPSTMIKSSLTEGNVLKMLKMADEYQALDVIKYCLEKIEITPSNAFSILPFASQYHATVREKCISVATTFVETKVLEENLPSVDRKDIEAILMQKCKVLEGIVERGRTNLSIFMGANKRNLTRITCPLSHIVGEKNLYKAKECEQCLKVYEEKFCSSYAGINGSHLLQLLKDTDDVLHQMDQRKTMEGNERSRDIVYSRRIIRENR